MSDISFRKCFELFEKFGRAGSSLRTFAACLVSKMDGYSPRLSHSWKAKVSRSLRFVFLLQPSARRTDATGFGLLPTIGSASKKGGGVTQLGGGSAGKARFQEMWAKAEAMLPTPTGNDISGANKVKMKNGRFVRDAGTIDHSANLNSIVSGLLPTPTTTRPHDTDKTAGEYYPSQNQKDLTFVMGQLETSGAQAGSTLRLEPAFVEWMMGYPLNWTSLEAENEDWPQMGAGTDAGMLPTPQARDWQTETETTKPRDNLPSLLNKGRTKNRTFWEAATTETQD